MAETQNANISSILTPSVPPPPSEVKVRTMRSDIDGIAKAGGGLPQFKTVPVEGMGLPRSRIGSGASPADAPGMPSSSVSKFPIWIIALIVAIFGLIAWFGWVIFFAKH
jgi:hypothetical protein